MIKLTHWAACDITLVTLAWDTCEVAKPIFSNSAKRMVVCYTAVF